MKRTRAGFTLVELIVVIAILGILAGIAIPVYSRYVKKANQAADEQLLAAVNTAAAAAVLDAQGTDMAKLDDGALTATKGPNITVTGLDGVDTAFTEKYFKGNQDAEFKYFERIEFRNGVFEGILPDGSTSGPSGWTSVSNGDGTTTYSNGTYNVTIHDEDRDNVMNSAFGEMGMDALMTEVNGLSTAASGIFTDRPEDIVTKMGPGFQSFLSGTLGKTADEIAAMDSKELMNSVILYTMDQSKNKNAADVMASVLDGSFKTSAQSGITEIQRKEYQNAGQTVSNVAMAYAMVMGFANSHPDAMVGGQTASEFFRSNTEAIQNEENSGTRAMLGVMGMLQWAYQSDDFQTYLRGDSGNGSDSDGMKDLQGYISAMNAAGGNISNLDTNALISNGVMDTDLLGLLNTVFGGN